MGIPPLRKTLLHLPLICCNFYPLYMKGSTNFIILYMSTSKICKTYFLSVLYPLKKRHLPEIMLIIVWSSVIEIWTPEFLTVVSPFHLRLVARYFKRFYACVKFSARIACVTFRVQRTSGLTSNSEPQEACSRCWGL